MKVTKRIILTIVLAIGVIIGSLVTMAIQPAVAGITICNPGEGTCTEEQPFSAPQEPKASEPQPQFPKVESTVAPTAVPVAPTSMPSQEAPVSQGGQAEVRPCQ